jgi:Carboxypeptidase regulatory-like domain
MDHLSKPQVGLKGVSQMDAKRTTTLTSRTPPWVMMLLTVASVLLPCVVAAQSLTGALIGTVKDEQGAVIPGALVRAMSTALIGGPATMITDETGQIRFPVLAPGSCVLDIEVPGFAPYHEQDLRIGAGATLE